MKMLAPFLLGLVFTAFADAQPVNQKGALLDEILRNVLESLREYAKDLAIPDATFKIRVKEANITGGTTGGLTENLDNFVIRYLATTFLPLSLTNLTLTLDCVTVTGNYTLNGTVDFPNFAGPFNILGEGPFKIDLYEIFFTIAADFKLQDFKLQIVEKGLKGFNFYINRSEAQQKDF